MKRIHIVMVPGFGGFDALGTLRYYAGVTPAWSRWEEEHPDAGAVLHYFDNLPTAGVKTRAKELRRWLAKRIARREIQGDDRIVLVGHSTGGLDIRRLLGDLHRGGVERVDGLSVDRISDVLVRIARVVFLSVPHYGTNLADAIDGDRNIARLVSIMRAGLGLTILPGTLTDSLIAAARIVPGPDAQILAATRDVELAMADRPDDDPWMAAARRQVRADVTLWFEHVDRDFLAIRDLVSRRRHEHVAELDTAVAVMKAHGVTARTFATVAPPPYSARSLERWRKSYVPWQVGIIPQLATKNRNVDATYAIGYALCARGPFEPPPPLGVRRLEAWENDGVVNTASMLHPFPGDEPVLVEADHGDILGHYQLAADDDGERRSYDLLGANAGFGLAEFTRVWDAVFDFAGTA